MHCLLGHKKVKHMFTAAEFYQMLVSQLMNSSPFVLYFKVHSSRQYYQGFYVVFFLFIVCKKIII
jgi:hypothetical protein